MAFWDRFKANNVRAEDVKKEKKSTGDYTSEQQKYRQHEDINTLEDAILSAQNLTNPNRQELHRIYSDIVLDPHLSAQWETRKMKTIEREFAVYKKGAEEPDDERTELLNSSWFFDFIHAALDSKLWGFSLIEFGKWDNNKFNYYRDAKNRLHKPIEVVNRDHVKPEFGYLLINPSDMEGLDIFKSPISNRTLFVGAPKDYGILMKCARYILFKTNCLNNWSEWAEVFAHDIRIGKTEAEGSDRKKLFDALKKMGASGYGVFDKEDVIEYLGTSRTDAYQVYDALNRYIDENVSKLIFGQDVVMNHTGRVRGTAAETITDLYGNNDAWFIQGIVNDELFPKMSNMGINMDGYELRWDNSEKITLVEKAEIDHKIKQMGFELDNDYITETYGTRLKEVVEGELDTSNLPEIYEYHIEGGIVKKNEVRARLGLPADDSEKNEEEQAELSRKLQVMKDAKSAGIGVEEAAKLAGFSPAEIKELVKESQEQKRIEEEREAKKFPPVANPEKVAEALKNIYGARGTK